MGEGETRVLLVDDDPIILRSLSRVLSDQFRVTSITDPRRALSLVLQEPFDVLVTDYEMPGLDGAELIARVRTKLGSALPIIVLTGTSFTEVPGADIVIHKPADTQQIVETIVTAIREKVQGVVA